MTRKRERVRKTIEMQIYKDRNTKIDRMREKKRDRERERERERVGSVK